MTQSRSLEANLDKPITGKGTPWSAQHNIRAVPRERRMSLLISWSVPIFLAASITGAAQNIEHYRTLKSERDRINDKLAALGAGEEVVAFLLAVAGQSATLAHVTGEVRDWLGARNSLGRFNVGL